MKPVRITAGILLSGPARLTRWKSIASSGIMPHWITAESSTISHSRRPARTGIATNLPARGASHAGAWDATRAAAARKSMRNCATFGGCCASRVTSPR